MPIEIDQCLRQISNSNDMETGRGITLVAHDQWSDYLAGLSAFQQAQIAQKPTPIKANTLIELTAEDGRAGPCLWVCDQNLTKEEAVWSFAQICAAVPAGTYHFTDTSALHLGAAALGWLLENYQFDRYKKVDANTIKCLTLPQDPTVDEAITAAEAIALGRDLINTPANDMGPDQLEATARELATQFNATLSVTMGANLEKDFPAIHAVGKAADIPPRLIDLTWGDDTAPKVTLVGKGVCFDTGGLNIKVANYMTLMKKDMGGAASVLSLAHMIMASGMKVRLRVLIPAVENAISGNAFRPGDVINTRKGLTVEIGNTDAEGRLVLCDALTLADEENPAIIIDMATLTGAARVALGPDLPPIYSRFDKDAAVLLEAGTQVADPLWHMPLWQGYMENLDSSVADTNNVTDDAFAGSITAALYLSKFIRPETKWLHFDVFGWSPKKRPGIAKGGHIMAVRAIYKGLEKLI